MPPKRKQRPGEVRRTVEALRAKKGVVATLYVVLRLAVLVILVAQFLNRNFENVFLCILTLFLFLVPTFIERKIHVDLPDTLEVIILLFIFAAEILGEIQAYYITFPYWDTMLHTLNGFLAAAVGFSMVILLNDNEKLTFELSPFFLALLAIYFFSVRLRCLPAAFTSDYGGGSLRELLRHLLLPALVIAVSNVGGLLKQTRSACLEVLGEDYITAGHSYGLKDTRMLWKYALKNSLGTTATDVALSMGYTLTGTFLVEAIFAWPGVGSYISDAVTTLDYPAIIGVTLFGATCYIVLNLLADIFIAMDPRVRL